MPTSDLSASPLVSTLLATLAEGVVVQSRDGHILFASEAAERILGLTADQMAGRTSMDPRWEARREDLSPWPGEDHPIMLALRDRTVTTDAIMNVRQGSGRRSWISINARPVIEGDDIVAAIATFRDITDERSAAAQADDNERQLLEALHASGLAVATSDADGFLLTANPGFCAMVARPESELIGSHFTELSGPDALDEQIEAVQRLRQGVTDQFQTFKSYVRPDGSLRFAIMNLVALRGGDGTMFRHVSLVQDLTDQLENEASLVADAHTDELTGALNRRGVLAGLNRSIATDPDQPMLVAYIDLDDFKAINDTYGHRVGDQALIDTVVALRSCVRSSDLVGRLGGDEFVVVCPGAPPHLGDKLVANFTEALAGVGGGGGSVPVRASVGIVPLNRGESADEVLARADEVMYRVKKQNLSSREPANPGATT